MDVGAIIVIGLFLFVLFIFFAVWRTECYDENESFLYNMGILALCILFWFVGLPIIGYVLFGGCAHHY